MRILVARLGAFGDTLITTPLIRYLKQQGHEIYYLTSDNGRTILENNPNVDKLIFHVRDSIENTKLGEYFEATKKLYECDKLIDLCESIEINLAFSPSQPQSKYPKFEKMAIANKNYYEETFDFVGRQTGDYGRLVMKHDKNFNPEMFFTEQEEKFIEEDVRIPYMGKKKILWGLSGSSRQKTYPPEYMCKVIKAFPDYIHITVGEEVCRLLEWPFTHPDVKDKFPNVVPRAAKFTMRESILACKYVDLVIAPDTGLLHGAGCFDTPKIGLLTNTSRENITKHFKNDYSLEATDVSCSPCYNLIYDANVQSQTDSEDGTPLCMKWGILPDRLIARVKEVFNAI